jgi:hypothetical protein
MNRKGFIAGVAAGLVTILLGGCTFMSQDKAQPKSVAPPATDSIEKNKKILIAIHLGFHWNKLSEKLCCLLRVDRTSVNFILLSRATALFIIGYGIYTSFTRHIGSKLLLQHMVNDWAATPSLIGFIVDYAAIMGCYVAITYYLTQLLQKVKS